MNLLLTDVTVGDRPGRAVHVVDGAIAWLGEAADAPAAEAPAADDAPAADTTPETDAAAADAAGE